MERPASVVKELVENAVDAGSTAITVEIKDGGISFIRVTDNGGGIPKEQVPLAFLRHATSKIERVEDLLQISSLGFRGEALSSISAVSQMEVITKTQEALTGVRYIIEGGQGESPGRNRCALRNYYAGAQSVLQHPGKRKVFKNSHDRGRICQQLYGAACSFPPGYFL